MQRFQRLYYCCWSLYVQLLDSFKLNQLKVEVEVQVLLCHFAFWTNSTSFPVNVMQRCSSTKVNLCSLWPWFTVIQSCNPNSHINRLTRPLSTHYVLIKHQTDTDVKEIQLSVWFPQKDEKILSPLLKILAEDLWDDSTFVYLRSFATTDKRCHFKQQRISSHRAKSPHFAMVNLPDWWRDSAAKWNPAMTHFYYLPKVINDKWA